LSLEQHRTKLVLRIIDKLVEEGRTEFRPGDITSRLREQNQPLATWEVRGELSNLEAAGMLRSDPTTGAWMPALQPSRKAG
jgi:hypothetical protein